MASYAAASFYPFEWAPPREVSNKAAFVPGGGIRFSGPGIARSTGAPGWVAAAKQSQRLELLLRVRCFAEDQYGPARIITLSSNPYLRNFTVGQAGGDLVFRLRTPQTTLNGTVGRAEYVQVPDVFHPWTWVDLRIIVEPGRLRIAIGGTTRVRKDLPSAPLRNWDPSYRLALGNELTYNRPWYGEIRRAEIRARGIAVNYADPSNVEIPSRFWIVSNRPNLVPFRDFNLKDSVLNGIAYIPFGLFFGGWSRRRTGLSAWYPVLIIFAVSLSLESMQICLARYSSIGDVIFNTLGGIVGLLLARTTLAQRWLEAKL